MSKPGSNSTKSSIANLPSVLMMVVVLIFLALALWNWRETGWPGLVWLAAAILMTVIRSPHSARNSRNEIVKHRKDVSEQVLLFLMFLTMMVLPVVHLGTRVFSFADFELPWQASAAGAALQPLALWLFWRSHADLGRNWSPTLEVRSEHALVSSGVYSRMRHPMYAAIWLFALTQPLLIPNWIAGALVIPAFFLMHVIRIPREEAMMREQFGAAYEEYCARTGRVFPALGRSRA